MDLAKYEDNPDLLNKITVGICTSGRWEMLEECLVSLSEQSDLQETVKVFLPLKPQHQKLFNSRLKDFCDLDIELISVDQYSASHLRNLFISKVKSGLLYLLDDDCSLPHRNHLKDLVAYHKALPKVALIGGRYVNSDMTSTFGRAYNLVCDLWQDRNDFFSQSNRLKHLLGGNLSLKVCKEIKNFRFGEDFEFGGEELSYLKQVQSAGYKVMLVNGLNVYHHSQHNWSSFLSRAWLHGHNKYFLEKENFGSVFKDRNLIFKKKKPWDELGIAAGYLAVTQASYCHQHLKNDFSSLSLGQWKQKLLKRTP